MSEHGEQSAYAGGSVGGGRYQLQRLLGEGGMASVHLAHDSVLDRQVAVKTLHHELGRDASFRERFRREAQAVARLSHPNVVSVFDTGEDTLDGAQVPYIVMEYVDGQPLRSVLDADVRQYGAMPTDKALKITADVLAALGASHEMGLVHRDIKPGNVMMTRRGVVKVMDFGIARAMQSGVTAMTQTGMVVGTPQYLSPEQALGRGVDARSDLYSVGIMLFELLTGRLPFDADSPLAIAYAHVQEEPPTPSALNQTVPPQVDTLVARALSKNPNDRFPSADEMAEESRRASGQTPPGAMPSVIAAGGPQNSGAGVGQAVFPPVNPQQQHAPQYNSPPPGTPGFGQPAAAGYGGFGPAGPATPPPHAPGGYQTPPPYSMSPAGAPTPPAGGGGGGNKNIALISTAIVVAVAAIAAVIIVVATSGDDGGKDPVAKKSPTASQDAGGDTGGGDTGGDGKAKVLPPDRSRVIDKEECTEAREHYDDKSKLTLPDFTYKDYLSVRSCARAAGWKIEETRKASGIWAKDTVLTQFPASMTAFDPKKDTIKLELSTGVPE
ncbi:serine/threonine protein kinase [Streptomyces sp. A7024]|uniref:non-specific serine/threonine protein kinase n=1 Tax=Streptomyces coryli TaxID=1128680 RepID=A0A6G4U751_9ACTN|nr:protein kinase [Streptomyces coryli]NGN67822.1 serine/threonine protein kinase [Streptomyces coryli]